MRRQSLVWLCAALSLAACSTLPSGHRYTFAKVAADRSLVPAHTLLGGDTGAADGIDSVIQVGQAMSLSLKGGYLRYLQDIDRPEVLIFVRVKVRPADVNQEPLVWEQVYLRSEDESANMVLGKDSFLPRLDIPLLPAIEYQGDEMQVQVRIIELDQDDNARVKSLVNTAAGVTAAFRPESAVVASTFQAVLGFFTAANTDDIEFEFDFAIQPGATAVIRSHGLVTSTEDMVLQPRVGTYALIKTENRDRAYYPSSYFDLTHNGVRYLVAEGLKLATLGIFNWDIWTGLGADRHDDFYMKIMGRPFGIDREAWAEPEFVDGKLAIPQFGGGIYWDGDHLIHRIHSQPEAFRAQSYVVLTIDRQATGLDLVALRQAAAAQARIAGLVKTGQLRGEEFDKAMQSVGTEVRTAVFQQQLTKRLQPALDKASSVDQVEAARQQAMTAVDKLLAERRISAEEATQLGENLRQRTDVALGAMGSVADGSGVTTPLPYVPLTGAETKDTKVSLALIHPVGTTLDRLQVRLPSGVLPKTEFTTSEVAGQSQTRVTFAFENGVPKAPAVVEVMYSIGDKGFSRPVTFLPAVVITGIERFVEGRWETFADPWQPGQVVRLTYAGTLDAVPGVGVPLTSVLPGPPVGEPIAVLKDAGHLRMTNTSPVANRCSND